MKAAKLGMRGVTLESEFDLIVALLESVEEDKEEEVLTVNVKAWVEMNAGMTISHVDASKEYTQTRLSASDTAAYCIS